MRTKQTVRYAVFLAIFIALAGIASAEMISLPKTGQTICYDINGNAINCLGTGQDGENQSGVSWPDPRFTNNNDGTISDQLTGLMWVENTATPTYGTCIGGSKSRWVDALSYVAYLNAKNYLGYGDWRLPNWNELESLVHLGQSNAISDLSNKGFKNLTSRNYYWSSTTFALDKNKIWTFALGDFNQVWWCFTTKYYNVYYHPMYAWPVRGTTSGPAMLWTTGQTASYASGDDGDLEKGASWPSPRFADNKDGTVTDKLTGLMWTSNANYPGRNIYWNDALKYVSDMNKGIYENYSYNDWRLPNIRELESLTDASRYAPALQDGHPFKTVSSAGQWSSTTVEGRPSSAWMYSLYHGHRTANSKTAGKALFWPVRDFRMKLPLPGGKQWLLTVEVGGPVECGGTDKYHSDVYDGYYSLDFVDRNFEDGELTGISDVSILAAANGTVKISDFSSSYGNTVVIDHGNGFKTRYAHMKDDPLVNVGDTVVTGQKLGIMGTTPGGDYSSGVHIHFQIYFNGHSLSTTKQLKSVVMEHLYLDEYQVGCREDRPPTGFYSSTNER